MNVARYNAASPGKFQVFLLRLELFCSHFIITPAPGIGLL
jgi:hypothetical protein